MIPDSSAPICAPALGEPSSHDQTPRKRLGFRADIEGLRALAILLVVAAHAKVTFLAGGYVGVDVFFVLSGYLITGLLTEEIRTTGSIRLVDFYARRLRRLLPALLLMVVCTGLAAAVLLAPFEQATQAPTAASAILWLSNLRFAFASLDYFGPAAETNLFLHTWSLGVEEQFYLVWPALVLFLLGAWQWQGRLQDFRRLRSGMLATAVICLGLSIFLTYTQPPAAFYTMPSRAWQFALGAWAFLLPSGIDGDDGNAGPRARTWKRMLSSPWLGWSGVVLILLSALLLDAQTPYPGGWALMPSLGAVAVLLAGAWSPGLGAGHWLAAKPLQRIGRVSYAWYLWHWPVLLLGATFLDMGNPIHVSLLVALSLLLAFVSYRLVEAPIRRNPKLIARPGLALLGGIALMAIACTAANGWGTLADKWSQQPEQRRFVRIRGDLPVLYGMGCDDWFHSARVQVCGFGSPAAEHTAVILGDSVALQWFPALAKVYDKPGWRLLVITKSSCPMVDAPIFYARIGRQYTECAAWRKSALEYVRSIRPDTIIFGSAVSYELTHDQWTQGTARVLDAMGADNGGAIYLLQAPPNLPFDGPACLSREHWRPGFLSRPERCAAASADPHRRDVHAWIAEAATRYGNVHLVDLDGLVCPAGVCSAERQGVLIFRDNQHLTAGFVANLDKALASKLP